MANIFKTRKKRDGNHKGGDDSPDISLASSNTSNKSGGNSPLKSSTLSNVVGGISGGLGGIAATMSGHALNAGNSVSHAANGAITSASNTTNDALSSAANAASGAYSSATGAGSNFINYGSSVSNNIVNKAKQMPDTVSKSINSNLQPQYGQAGQPGKSEQGVRSEQSGHNRGDQIAYSQGTPQQNNQQRGGPQSFSPNTVGSPASTGRNTFGSPMFPPSETPWAEYPVQRAAPSPRFGHSANYVTARDGELFIMGGIREMDILDDLWVIDTNTLTGYQLVTDGHKVGARVGHASLVLGNAHVVFGGDTKIEESDPLDDNLYLLNTSSLKWTVAQPQGPRPHGRYGHSLCNVGARVYVFGGQVDEEFYDDMWSFDLTTWRSPTAKWDRIHPATPPPPARTNHTVVTYEDKIYLFGGANGDLWYSDTWCFDPTTRVWKQLECSGYVPAPCQGHASTIIGDVMYVFGGMSSQGLLIDQLFALKLTTLKWYTFQNLGPGPSPRSGHSITAFGGDKILVWGGTEQGNSAYVLDVSRINYPEDSTASAASGASANSPMVTSPGRSLDQMAGYSLSNVPSVDAPRPPAHGAEQMISNTSKVVDPSHTASAYNDSHGLQTTKEIRELQPHIYAPQSTDTSGPTQAKSNSAARNSMLFSKRRSVLISNAPIKDRDSFTQSNANLGNIDSISSTSGNDQNLGVGLGAGIAGAAGAVAGAVGATALSDGHKFSDTRAPNRKSAQVKSYVTEESPDPHDERFVSATDLNKDHSNASAVESKSTASSHTRGLSFGINHSEENDQSRRDTLTTSNSDQFRKLEKELHGMPGGISSELPDGHQTDVSEGSTVPSKISEDTPKTPGIRRSQPQTNLALTSMDSNDENNPERRFVPSPQMKTATDTTGAAQTVASKSLGQDSQKDSSDTKTLSNDNTKPALSSSPKVDRNSSLSSSNRLAGASSPKLTASPKTLKDLKHSTESDNSPSIGSGVIDTSTSGELASLRRQIDAYRQRDFDDEHHQLKHLNIQQQRDLTNLRDSNAQLSRKLATVTNQCTDYRLRYEQLEKVMDNHVKTLESQQVALEEANAKLKEQQQQLTQLSMLQSENADLKLKLQTAESAQRHAQEQLDAMTQSYSSLKSAHSDLSARHLAASGNLKDSNGTPDSQNKLNDHVTHLVTLWGQFKMPKPEVREANASSNSDNYRQLYETHKDASDRAHKELEAAYQSHSSLKSQLRELSTLYANSPSQADVDSLKEQHKSALSNLDSKYNTALRDLDQHKSAVEDLRSRLSHLEKAHSDLQNEYNKAIDLSRNQQVALTKTREELNMNRAHAQRLEEQLEDANLQNTTAHSEHVGGDGDISHNSVGSTRNDQAALVIRDLRAQVVILEEEMQNQREQIMRLKKAALTK